jgi:hypothetical protein
MLTLLFVPVLYTYLDDLGRFLTRHGLMSDRWDPTAGGTPPALVEAGEGSAVVVGATRRTESGPMP